MSATADYSNLITMPTVPRRRYAVFPARADLIQQGEIILPGLWHRLHDEGIFETFFHDFPDITFGQFVCMLSSPTDRIEVVCEVGEGPDAPIIDTAGIGLLTQIMKTATVSRALGNFLFFKSYWGTESAILGRTLLDGWFKEFDVIAGTTPELNHRAIHFVRGLGFREVGMIPDFSSYRRERCGSVVSSQTRREWMETRERLFGSSDGS